MKAVICNEPYALSLVDRPSPQAGVGEVLIRIRRVGLCGTDYHIFAGRHPFLAYPRVMGHELGGEVVQAPAGSTLRVGQIVAINPYLACGTCVACRKGKPNACVRISVLGVHADGGMCELLAVPERAIIDATGLTLDQAAMLEFLAIGAHAVRRADVSGDQRVLVVGAGPIGMAAMIFAKLRGANVTCLDTRADRLAFCQSQLNVDAAVAVGPDDTAQLASLTNNEFFDVVFDATGNIDAMNRGFGFVAHGGKYTLISIVPGQVTFSDPEFHKREMTLLASRNATTADFETVLDAMRSGRIPDQALNTHRMRLADVPDAFPRLLETGQTVVKALVEC